MKKMLKENKGFSLVELLIALLIMAVIAGTAITLFGGVLETSKSGADKETAESIKRALLTYVNASNDVDLSALFDSTMTSSPKGSELIAALSKKTVITSSGATNGSTATSKGTGDMIGDYGPFLESATIAPTQNGKSGWNIHYDKVTQIISVTSDATDAAMTITGS